MKFVHDVVWSVEDSLITNDAHLLHNCTDTVHTNMQTELQFYPNFLSLNWTFNLTCITTSAHVELIHASNTNENSWHF